MDLVVLLVTSIGAVITLGFAYLLSRLFAVRIALALPSESKGSPVVLHTLVFLGAGAGGALWMRAVHTTAIDADWRLFWLALPIAGAGLALLFVVLGWRILRREMSLDPTAAAPRSTRLAYAVAIFVVTPALAVTAISTVSRCLLEQTWPCPKSCDWKKPLVLKW